MGNVISNQHQRFIELVSKGETFQNAYQQSTNKKPTAKTARENGSKLAKRYKNEIATARDNYQKDIAAAKKESVINEALNSILTQAEVDAKLCSIINGTHETEEIIFIEGSPTSISRKPTANEVKGAIDIYYKRFGSYASIKQDVTIKQEQPLFPDV